ncbi:MAG: hypothetical protein FWD57_09245 [Polyangiaceae bacterium]|nr:hypothetical protein [Polyangiaceae bacterium]
MRQKPEPQLVVVVATAPRAARIVRFVRQEARIEGRGDRSGIVLAGHGSIFLGFAYRCLPIERGRRDGVTIPIDFVFYLPMYCGMLPAPRS